MIDDFGRQFRRFHRRVDDDAPARQAFADIVVSFSLELEGHAFGEEGPKTLTSCSLELDMNRLVTQAGMAVSPGDDARQHRPGRTIGVANGKVETHVFAPFDRLLRIHDEASVEYVLKSVVLSNASINGVFRPGRWLEEEVRKVEPLRLGVLIEPVPVQHLPLANHFVERSVAKFGHQFADVFGDEEEIVDHVLGLANEALAQNRVLCRDPDRASVQMAFAHHDAAGRDQWSGGEAELVCAQKRADHDIATCAHAAVDLHGDPRSQPVHHQRLMSLSETDLPRASSMLDGGQRRSSGATLEARDRDVVRFALCDSRRDRADTDFGHQFDRNLGLRIDVFQIVDELLQVFDRINVMVRRRRYEAHALSGVTHLGDHCVDLMARQLSAFARLCALRHFNLHHVGVDQIFRGHPEAARGDLLDGAAHRVAIGHPLVAIGLFTALAGV